MELLKDLCGHTQTHTPEYGIPKDGLVLYRAKVKQGTRAGYARTWRGRERGGREREIDR